MEERGRRTGFHPKYVIRVDDDGLENVNEFFESESETTSVSMASDRLSVKGDVPLSPFSLLGNSNYPGESPRGSVGAFGSETGGEDRQDTLLFLEHHARRGKRKHVGEGEKRAEGYGLTYKFSSMDKKAHESSDDSDSSFITIDGESSGDDEAIFEDDDGVRFVDIENEGRELRQRYRPLSKENYQLRKRKEIVSKLERGSGAGRKYEVDERGRRVRRSARVRYAPLDYWRNERVEYRKDYNDSTAKIDKIVRVPEYTPRKRTRRKRVLIQRGGFMSQANEQNAPSVVDKTAGIAAGDVNTGESTAEYVLPESHRIEMENIEKKIIPYAVSGNMLKFEPAPSAENLAPGESPTCEIARIFSSAGELSTNVWAAGVLKIYPHSSTPERSTLGVTEMFYVIYGDIVVKMNKTKFNLKGGSHFFVPPNHDYEIGNISPHDALLTFTALLSNEKDEE